MNRNELTEVISTLEAKADSLEFYVKTYFKKMNVLVELDRLKRVRKALSILKAE